MTSAWNCFIDDAFWLWRVLNTVSSAVPISVHLFPWRVRGTWWGHPTARVPTIAHQISHRIVCTESKKYAASQRFSDHASTLSLITLSVRCVFLGNQSTARMKVSFLSKNTFMERWIFPRGWCSKVEMRTAEVRMGHTPKSNIWRRGVCRNTGNYCLMIQTFFWKKTLSVSCAVIVPKFAKVFLCWFS